MRKLATTLLRDTRLRVAAEAIMASPEVQAFQRTAGLVDHAHRELELAGLFDPSSDYDGALGHAVMDLVKMFSSQGHSGGSAAMVSELFNQLSHYKGLTPCDHTNPEHVMDVSGPQGAGGTQTFQCRRVPSHFSNDGGQSWFDIDDAADIAREQERLHQQGMTSIVNPMLAHLAEGLSLLREARHAFAPFAVLTVQPYAKPGVYIGRTAAAETLDSFLKDVEEADPQGALYGEAEFDDLPEIPEGMEPLMDQSAQVGDLHAVAVEYHGPTPHRALVWSEAAFRVGGSPWSIVDCEGHSLGLSDREEE